MKKLELLTLVFLLLIIFINLKSDNEGFKNILPKKINKLKNKHRRNIVNKITKYKNDLEYKIKKNLRLLGF